jgi:hypothetical protein
MAGRSEVLPQDRRQWLLAIGQRLRAEYSAVKDPIPERLATLLAQLDAPTHTAPVDKAEGALERPAPERKAASVRSGPSPACHKEQTASAGLDLR